jgi:hypothetical protein
VRKVGAECLTFRDTLVSITDEPQKSEPKSKAAHGKDALRPDCVGVRCGVCGFSAAVADAVVCAWAAVRDWLSRRADNSSVQWLLRFVLPCCAGRAFIFDVMRTSRSWPSKNSRLLL